MPYLWFLQTASDLHLSLCQLILNYGARADSELQSGRIVSISRSDILSLCGLIICDSPSVCGLFLSDSPSVCGHFKGQQMSTNGL